jgi:hypothetical protein
MKWIRNFLTRIRNWFAPSYRAVTVDDLPDEPKPNTLYLVGNETPWQAAMRCPCGCKALIQLSLVPHDRPRWTVKMESSGEPTLTPSIWRKKGCGAHFFLRNGRILWC